MRDHVRGKLLVALPLEIGKSLPGFGVLTRKGEPLAEHRPELGRPLRRRRRRQGAGPLARGARLGREHGANLRLSQPESLKCHAAAVQRERHIFRRHLFQGIGSRRTGCTAFMAGGAALLIKGGAILRPYRSGKQEYKR